MKLLAAGLSTVKYLAALAPQAVHRPARSPFVHMLLGFGLFGVFLVSIVDSSFVPLPLPGVTDIMIIVLAAQHQLVAARVAGIRRLRAGRVLQLPGGPVGRHGIHRKTHSPAYLQAGLRLDGESRDSVRCSARHPS